MCALSYIREISKQLKIFDFQILCVLKYFQSFKTKSNVTYMSKKMSDQKSDIHILSKNSSEPRFRQYRERDRETIPLPLQDGYLKSQPENPKLSQPLDG